MKKQNKELPVANRKYKDTIFRWLFSDRRNLLSLYNAISGKHYQNPEALNVVTLENAVYVYTDQIEHTARCFSAWLPPIQCTLSGHQCMMIIQG